MATQTVFGSNPTAPMVQMVVWNSQEGRYEVLDYKSLAVGSGGGTTVGSSDFFSATTSTGGTGWTTLTGITCDSVNVVNDTNFDVEVRKNTGNMIAKTIEASSVYKIEGLSNTNEVDVRRVDQSTTQLSMVWEWEQYA